MTPNNTLPEEVRKEILSKTAEATSIETHRLKLMNIEYGRMVSQLHGFEKGHRAGATEYATKMLVAQEDFKRVQKSAIHYANRKDEVEKQRNALQAKADRMEKALREIKAEHADLNLALAAMLNGYQNLSIDQKDWFTVPKNLIDEYTRMVIKYNGEALKEGGEDDA